MNNNSVKAFLDYLNDPKNKKNDLFDAVQKVSLQVCLHKIPNMINEKHILCKLPHTINDGELEACLFVKDIDKKNRDYEDTIIKQIIPMKQLKLEFRPFELKRKLASSFDLFLADKCLHEILYQGSHLGKEFQKRRKMPLEIDLEKEDDLHKTVAGIVDSTLIRLNGKGTLLDINCFLSSHSVAQATENLVHLKSELLKNLPGGEANIKSLHLKATNSIAVPVYVDMIGDPNKVKVPNNMTPVKVKKIRKMTVKRLKRKAILHEKQKKKSIRDANKRNKTAASRSMLQTDALKLASNDASIPQKTGPAKRAAPGTGKKSASVKKVSVKKPIKANNTEVASIKSGSVQKFKTDKNKANITTVRRAKNKK